MCYRLAAVGALRPLGESVNSHAGYAARSSAELGEDEPHCRWTPASAGEQLSRRVTSA